MLRFGCYRMGDSKRSDVKARIQKYAGPALDTSTANRSSPDERYRLTPRSGELLLGDQMPRRSPGLSFGLQRMLQDGDGRHLIDHRPLVPSRPTRSTQSIRRCDRGQTFVDEAYRNRRNHSRKRHRIPTNPRSRRPLTTIK